jgi:hypothetical protein
MEALIFVGLVFYWQSTNHEPTPEELLIQEFEQMDEPVVLEQYDYVDEIVIEGGK